MSKKIAVGIDVIVLDVKVGSGAFMKTVDDRAGWPRPCGHGEPVGRADGGAHHRDGRAAGQDGRQRAGGHRVRRDAEGARAEGLEELSVVLAARMVLAAGLAASRADADAQVQSALASGTGLEKWREIVTHQGGDPRTVDDYGLMPSVPTRHVVTADRAG